MRNGYYGYMNPYYGQHSCGCCMPYYGGQYVTPMPYMNMPQMMPAGQEAYGYAPAMPMGEYNMMPQPSMMQGQLGMMPDEMVDDDMMSEMEMMMDGLPTPGQGMAAPNNMMSNEQMNMINGRPMF